MEESDSSDGWTIVQPEPTQRQRYTIPRRAPEGGSSIWDLALAVWPLEDRPEPMKDPLVVNGMDLQTLFSFKEHYEILQKKEGKGEGVFGKDSAIPPVLFEAGEDNCTDLLHPAR